MHKTPALPVSCTYGAPMGRPSGHPGNLADEPGKFYLVRVPINSGGYDAGGAYWGIGQTLYYFESPSGESGYLRAAGRASAKQKVRELAPLATFYR